MSAKGRCPTCKNTVSLEGDLPAHFPFCSKRCQMIDLGKWFEEAYSVPVESPRVLDEALNDTDDTQDPPPEDPSAN